MCKALQVGGSECAHNFVGYAIDRRSGPVLYIYPDELTAKENSKDRIIPMIESSPRLRTYMTGSDDDATSVKIKLTHMPIYLAWARSASRLANKPIRYLVFDETDKYPALANKKEADPISLGEKRAITYRNSRKSWKLSTPTTETGYIWMAMTTEAQAVFKYHVVRPLKAFITRSGPGAWAPRRKAGRSARGFCRFTKIRILDYLKRCCGRTNIRTRRKVHLSVIDAMGHHTAEVYDWCRRHRGRVFPIIGEQL